MDSTQGLIDTSAILYVDPDKKRTNAWLSHNQLQLPLGITKYGPIGRIAKVRRDVNGNFSSESENFAEELPEWKKKLREYEFSAGEETVEVPEYLTDIEKALEQSGAEVYTPETLDAVLKEAGLTDEAACRKRNTLHSRKVQKRTA